MTHKTPTALKITTFLEAQSGWLILLIVFLTVALAVPMVLLTPDQDASDNPGGPVYDLQDTVDTQLPSRIFTPFFIDVW